MDFSAAVQAQLAGRRVQRGVLVELLFLSGPKRVWNGARRLTTADGKVWEGMFGLGRVEGLKQAINGAAPEMRLIVSGVDETFAAKAKAEAAEYLNRAVIVYSQFFNEDWSLLDAPFAVAWARMRGLNPSMEMTEDGAVHTVTVTAETPFGDTKRRPRHSYMTDRDQQLRYPNDRGAERTPGLETKTIIFPT